VTITLFGARPPTKAERDALPPTFKGIVVSSTGSLDLHGQRFYRTWTRLAAPVSPGDTTVYLQRAVNWEPGQQVLLTTTALKDARDYHRNEVLVLSSLLTPPAGVGAALQLTSAAQFAHGANSAWQGEVALLSRRIVVQGSAADSEPTDTTPIACTTSRWALGSNSVPCVNSFLTGFGGHVLVMGQGRVSGRTCDDIVQSDTLTLPETAPATAPETALLRRRRTPLCSTRCLGAGRRRRGAASWRLWRG
jgi:hypothetical protein